MLFFMSHRRLSHSIRAVAVVGTLVFAGCSTKETSASNLSAAAPSASPTAVVKTYACKVCGSVSSKPNRVGRCPRQKDGGPCKWKEIPRTN